jgi:SAM-dependent methyltransferase
MNAAQLELNARVEDQHWWFLARRQIMRSLVDTVLTPGASQLIVDVGCGTGGNIGALSDAYRCVGIDTSEVAISLARARFPQVRFHCGLAPEDLGPSAGEASLYLLMDVLEHVPDDFHLLSSLFESSRPGTHFLITVPADPQLWSQHDVSHLHYRRYDQARFERIWQGLPVTTLACSYFNARLYPVIKSLRTINRWRNRTSGEADTDFWLPSPVVNRGLRRIFAGEQRTLVNLVAGGTKPYRRGVSLLALLRRDAGRVTPLTRPDDVAPDEHAVSEPAGELMHA